MEIFWRLLLAHLVADFTLQTNAIANWKKQNVWGLSLHCAVHFLAYIIFLFPFLNTPWLQWHSQQISGLVCIIFITITHFTFDAFKVRATRKFPNCDNSAFYLLDQALHIGTIYAFSPFKPEDNFLTLTQNQTWIFIALLVVAVTHFFTISIYFFEKDLAGKPFPSPIQKYLPMAERLILLGCFFLPLPLALTLATLWTLRHFYHYRNGQYWDKTYLLLSCGFTIFCGLCMSLFLL